MCNIPGRIDLLCGTYLPKVGHSKRPHRPRDQPNVSHSHRFCHRDHHLAAAGPAPSCDRPLVLPRSTSPHRSLRDGRLPFPYNCAYDYGLIPFPFSSLTSVSTRLLSFSMSWLDNMMRDMINAPARHIWVHHGLPPDDMERLQLSNNPEPSVDSCFKLGTAAQVSRRLIESPYSSSVAICASLRQRTLLHRKRAVRCYGPLRVKHDPWTSHGVQTCGLPAVPDQLLLPATVQSPLPLLLFLAFGVARVQR